MKILNSDMEFEFSSLKYIYAFPKYFKLKNDMTWASLSEHVKNGGQINDVV